MENRVIQTDAKKIGRNEPCPCGSGKKYKQCCGELALSPAHYCNLGNSLRTQGKLDEAIANFRKALAISPEFAEAHNDLGAALHSHGKLDEAVLSFRAAISLKPDFAWAHNNLGFTLSEQGLLDDAIVSYRNALSLEPDFAAALGNLGNALLIQSRLDEAVASHRKAIAIMPDHAEAHYDLARALWEQGKLDEAAAGFRAAISLKPEFAWAHNNLGMVLQESGRFDDAVASYRTALACKPVLLEAHSNLLFCLNYHPDLAAGDIFAEYCRWDTAHARPLLGTSAHANLRDPGRRLRIGYVSPDLRQHSARHCIEPLLAHHDKSLVEVFAYAEVAKEDAVSGRFKGYVEQWRRTVGLTDDEMAALIRADGIDILVDLAGHTGGSRLHVFARKPAPVQVTWLGFGYTTGMSAMDYFLADAVFAPPGCELVFTEKIARLPVFTAYRPAEHMGEPGALPALESGTVTFGTLSRSLRINHRVIRTWAAILQRLPASRLLINSKNFQSASLQASLRERFAAHGIPAERLLIGYDSPPWDVLRRIDISLDCFPHNSGTTLIESLYLGVPYITLAGRPSVGRLGSAVVTAAGHPEWIAGDEADYVDKAVHLAADIDRLAAIRATLREEMRRSPLMNESAFAHSVESAYREMWRQWCAAPG